MRAQRKILSRKDSGPILTIFDTHPIQYRSPVFSELSKRMPGTQVYFFSESFNGRRWWFKEYDKSPKVDFNLPLKVGFKSETLKYRNPFDFISQVAAILGRSDAILIYGYYLWEHWAILVLAKLRRVPILFVGETFDLGPKPIRRWVKKKILPFIFNRLDRILTIGKKNHTYYRSLKIRPKRLVEARYCVDGDFFQSADRSKLGRETREFLRIPEDAFILLFVGRLFDRKRPLDVIDIHSRLFAKFSNLYTIIVGSGELEGQTREESSRLPRFIVTGSLDQKNVRKIYCSADALIVPSEFETWGLVVNEAMHCGVPAIVTETCGVANDLVIPDETGFVYPVGNTDKAAEAIGELISNPKLHKQMSNRCRELVEKKFSVDQFAEAIETAVCAVRKN